MQSLQRTLYACSLWFSKAESAVNKGESRYAQCVLYIVLKSGCED